MEYLPETGERICLLIAGCESAPPMSLREVCRLPGMPAMGTVFRWLERFHEFQEHYARARELQMEFFLDEILEIADMATPTPYGVKCARLRIFVRERRMKQLAPKKYAYGLWMNSPERLLELALKEISSSGNVKE